MRCQYCCSVSLEPGPAYASWSHLPWCVPLASLTVFPLPHCHSFFPPLFPHQASGDALALLVYTAEKQQLCAQPFSFLFLAKFLRAQGQVGARKEWVSNGFDQSPAIQSERWAQHPSLQPPPTARCLQRIGARPRWDKLGRQRLGEGGKAGETERFPSFFRVHKPFKAPRTCRLERFNYVPQSLLGLVLGEWVTRCGNSAEYYHPASSPGGQDGSHCFSNHK